MSALFGLLESRQGLRLPRRPAETLRLKCQRWSQNLTSRLLRQRRAAAAAGYFSAFFLLAILSLGGCASLTPTTATSVKAQCSAFRNITYSQKADSGPTIRQVKVHNLSGHKLGCW